jgi:hypothetical protein
MRRKMAQVEGTKNRRIKKIVPKRKSEKRIKYSEDEVAGRAPPDRSSQPADGNHRDLSPG